MTREEAKNLLYDKHGEDDKLIDQIYDDHEAQLKAKDEEIIKLYNKFGEANEKSVRNGYKLGISKARSIVAMLFWEWRNSEARIYATNIKWKAGRAFQSQILFDAAYKMLKEQQ